MDCKIRSFQKKDAVELSDALNNLNVQKNLRDGIPYPYTPENATEYITAMLTSDKTCNFTFAITVDGKVVGCVGATRQGNVHFRTAELGYYIAEPYWGKGIVTSSVKQICRYIFSETNILRIYAEPFAYNTASCRVLEKAGFTCEGTLRCNVEKNGNVLDMKMYSILKNEFKS